MQSFLFTKDGFINLDNVCYMTPAPGAEGLTHTRMVCPAVDLKIEMPWPEVKAMIEKLIRDQYEYNMKWYNHSAAQRKQDLEDMVDKLTGNHGR